MYWETVLVVDQEILDLTIVSDAYWIPFNATARLDIAMRWGSRVALTW